MIALGIVEPTNQTVIDQIDNLKARFLQATIGLDLEKAYLYQNTQNKKIQGENLQIS